MMMKSAALLVAAWAASFTGPALALGLGDLKLKSAIGQPLHAEAEVFVADQRELNGASLRPASPSEYQKMGFDFNGQLATAKVRTEKRGNSVFAIITTERPITEPSMTLIVEGDGLSGRVRRIYSLLVSPDPTVAGLTSQVLRGSVPSEAASVRIDSTPPPAAPRMFEPKVPKNYDIASESFPSAQPARVAGASRYTHIDEVGVPGANVARISGAAGDQPVVIAIKSLVPGDWRGYAGDPSVKVSGNVSWTGGNRTWPEVLDDVLSRSNLFATIDWNKKEVVLRSLPANAAVATAKPDAARNEAAYKAEVAALDRRLAGSQPKAAPPAGSAVLSVAQPSQKVAGQASANDDAAAKAQIAALQRQLDDERATAAEALWAAVAAQASAGKLQADLRIANERVAALDASVQAAKAQPVTPAQQQAAAAAVDSLNAQLSKATAEEAAARQRAEAAEARAARAEQDRQQALATAAAAKAQADRSAVAATAAPAAPATTAALPATSAPAAKPVTSSAITATTYRSLTLLAPIGGDQPNIRGGGYNVPVYTAVRQLIPQGWQVYTRDAAVADVSSISWVGRDRDWLAVLDETLAAHNLRATIDPQRREVSLALK